MKISILLLKMIKFLTFFFLNFFDFIHKKKIINFFYKNKIDLEYIIDVGAHHGESINLFSKYFKPKKIYSFEASPQNYIILKKKYNKYNENLKKIIQIENIALGKDNRIQSFNQTNESSSSTFNKINIKSNYFLKKKFFLGQDQDKDFFKTIELKIISLDSYFLENNLKKIDLLKIDTEGFEYEVLQGLQKNMKHVNYILFEHHYDDMIKKNYKFKDINKLLKYNNFKLIYKSKMPFRKSFEYIFGKEDI
tara:strand:+ start:953 stop:1702 length:750 start_codon:yes stop_codon:yes gene_type:complete